MHGVGTGTGTHTHHQLPTVHHQRGAECRDDALAQRADIFDAAGVFPDHGELIPAEPRRKPALTHHSFEAFAHGHQHAVAERVPHPIVDVLEVVDVQKHDAHQVFTRARALDGRVEQRKEVTPVRQSGQRITLRQFLQAAGAFLDLLFQIGLVVSAYRPRCREFRGHGVEGRGQRVKLGDAVTGHVHRVLPGRDLGGGVDQPAHRRHDGQDDADTDDDHDHRRGPARPDDGAP